MESHGTIGNTTPPVVFKYCSFPSLLCILKGKTFRANPPASENDPAECIPAGLDHTGLVHFVETSVALRRSIRNTLLSLRLPADNASIEAAIKAIGPDVVSGIENARTPDGWRRTIANRVAFVSFSEHADSEYMWTEYGDMHRGVRLSFSSNRLQGLHHVLYSNTRISPNPELPLGSPELRNNILDWLTTKEENGKWNLEGEWRSVFKWEETKRQEDSNGKPFMLVLFDPESLLEVQLGRDCPHDAEQTVESLITDFPNVKISRERIP